MEEFNSMKLLKKLIILLLGFSVGGVFAQSAYLGYGLGLQVNLGDLGGTITKDGLENRFGNRKIIIPENTIDVLHRSGLVTREMGGAMTGLALSAFYERDLADFFYRIEGAYTRKILGGHTKAQLAGFTLIDQNWDFYSIVVPLYLGIKANVSESASVYGAFGVNYFRGGWKIYGTVDGATPCQVGISLTGSVNSTLCGLAPNGADIPTIGTTAYNDPGLLYSGAILGEEIVFDVAGIGFNFLLGIDKKLQSGNKFYFEIEYLLSAQMDNAPVRSIGTITQLAPTGSISYPIVVGGVRYKLGFKQPL